MENCIDRSCLDSDMVAWLDVYSKRFCIPFEAAFATLLFNATSVCANSYTEINEGWKEPLTMYLLLIGHSGTNKGSSIKLGEKSMRMAEDFLNEKDSIPDKVECPDTRHINEYSNINYSHSGESLLELLNENYLYHEKKYANLVQYWRYIEMLSGSFGRFDDGDAVLDSHFYTTLYRGPDMLNHRFNKDYYEISNPRLCIFGAGYEGSVIGHLEDEKFSDGFYSKFMFFQPEPLYLKLSEIPDFDEKFRFENLLVIVKILHKKPVSYKLTRQALEYAKDYIKKNEDSLKSSNYYIQTAYSEFEKHFFAIVTSLWIIKSAFKYRNDFVRLSQNKNDLVDFFEKIVIDEVIDGYMVKMGACVNDYFFNHRLSLFKKCK